MKIVILFLFICSVSFCQTSWFDENIINCVVLLEKQNGNEIVPHGTGFLIYNYNSPSDYYVVTCEHVLRNEYIYVKIPADSSIVSQLKASNKMAVDFGNSLWLLDGHNFIHGVKLKRDSSYVANDKLDIGVFTVRIYGAVVNKKDSSEQKYTNIKGIPMSLISEKKKTKLGDEIYFLGFPFAIGTERGWLSLGKYSDEISNPLLRTGTIAYKSNSSQEFLLDALSYSGNSGSPVFTKQGMFNKTSKLIGMIVGHLPSMGSDNMGLARAVWVDEIMKLIEKYKQLNK